MTVGTCRKLNSEVVIDSFLLSGPRWTLGFFPRRRAAAAALAAACLFVLAQVASAQQYRIDRGASNALSQYLKTNKLPLVGAQVSRDASGQLQVMLYGFVASELGKSDAEAKTRKFLKQPSLLVINRIKVNPEIRDLGSAQSGSVGQGPGGNDWNRVMEDIRRQGYKSAPDTGGVAP